MKIDKSVLIDQAWEMLQGALHSGILVMGNGQQKSLSPKELAAIARWVASLDATRKREGAVLPDDYRLPGA